VQTHPLSSGAEVRLGDAYFASDEKDRAADCYRKAVALSPTNGEAIAKLHLWVD
jgi:cytochrome c-type biogenesis protein CcmH/NrfG